MVAASWRSIRELLDGGGGTASPEVILMDVKHGEMPSCRQVDDLRERYDGVRIALLVERMINLTILGPEALDVDGVLLESAAPEAMIKSLELLALGERFFPAPLPMPTRGETDAPLDRRIAQPHEPILVGDTHGLCSLTDRERQVLEALAHGAPNKMIARKLEISDATVKVHVKSILRKTGARNRTEAALWAYGAHQADSTDA
ncbi:two-component system, NarL family, nitrate/nitrite response regulator NarL [Albimonas pacifica]|uniref:Two-component system, NarL family, nitrate/nitrite response regulator NarL n=1 Tax=Albimonas pacifica TaxID=1114924 RepID=A0A1I3IXI2_9RHOB|nr:two-component system, NarL family, nitrate/nitrite response regulator NarL [Albimonas pacifica]